METSRPFIFELRRVCESIFDTMLCAYIAGLKAYFKQSEENGKKQGTKRPSLDGWGRAGKSAELALRRFRDAEDQRHEGNLDYADATVDQAFRALQERYVLRLSVHRLLFLTLLSTGAVPTFYCSPLIMNGWDPTEVRKA